VTITGTATSVIPFMTLTVHAEAVGPIEKFTPIAYEFTNSEALEGPNRSGDGR
jgi:hypothetical protein